MTNKQYAVKNEFFREACEKAKVEPTARQASKWRRKTGKAYTDGRFTPVAEVSND